MSQTTLGLATVTNGSNQVVGDADTDWTDVVPGQIFSLPESNVWYEITACVYSTGAWRITLATNYGGTTQATVSYVIHESFTPTYGFPYPEQGDTQTASIFKRSMLLIEEFIASGSLKADTRRSVAVNNAPSIGDCYGIEQVSAAQTGDNPALRMFTSTQNSAYLAFGKYTNSTTFSEFMRLNAAGGMNLTGNFLNSGSITSGSGSFTANAPATSNRQYLYQTSGSTRWATYASNTAESGSNVGSDFFINRYSDAGSLIDTSLKIVRSTGLITLGATTSSGVVIASTTASTTTTTGALTIAGGVGILGNLNMSGAINVGNGVGAAKVYAKQTGASFASGVPAFEGTTDNPSTGGANHLIGGNRFGASDTAYRILISMDGLFAWSSGSAVADAFLTRSAAGTLRLTATTASSSATTGCLTLAGGLGVSGDTFTTGNIRVDKAANDASFTLNAISSTNVAVSIYTNDNRVGIFGVAGGSHATTVIRNKFYWSGLGGGTLAYLDSTGSLVTTGSLTAASGGVIAYGGVNLVAATNTYSSITYTNPGSNTGARVIAQQRWVTGAYSGNYYWRLSTGTFDDSVVQAWSRGFAVDNLILSTASLEYVENVSSVFRMTKNWDGVNNNQNGHTLYMTNYHNTGVSRTGGVTAGQIQWQFSAPTGGALQDAAAISCQSDGTQSGTSTNSALRFYTTATTTLVERLRIDSGGQVFITGGTLVTQGGLVQLTSIKTANYTVTINDHIIVCNSSSTFTVTLIAASTNTGRTYVIKNKGSASITVDATSLGTIDGTNTFSLATGQSLILSSDGAQWNII